MGIIQQTPNFYEFPTSQKQQTQDGGGISTLGMPGGSYDN